MSFRGNGQGLPDQHAALDERVRGVERRVLAKSDQMVLVRDEGTALGSAAVLDFVGAGIAATFAGDVATITVSGTSLREYGAVIAPFDAPDAVKAAADYVCTGTSDDAVVQQAVADLITAYTAVWTSGVLLASILLRNGHYNFAAPVTCSDIVDNKVYFEMVGETRDGVWISVASGQSGLLLPLHTRNVNLTSLRGSAPGGITGADQAISPIPGGTIRDCYAEFFEVGMGYFADFCRAFGCYVGFQGSNPFRCVAETCGIGYDISAASGAFCLESWAEQCSVAGIQVINGAAPRVENNLMRGCGITLDNSSRTLIAGNRIESGSATDPDAIALTNDSDDCYIHGNQIWAYGGYPSAGVSLDATSDNNIVVNNALDGSGVSDSGSGNTVAPNY